VPKIAQLVEGRIHSWLDERCVEPRYQEIILPSMWPRRKNTRGGDMEDGGEETETETETEAEAGTGAGTGTGASASASAGAGAVGEEDASLEARMAEEGRKMLAAEGRRANGRHGAAGLRRRNQAHDSADELRIPGQFD
jgi:maintenance of morphology protein 1